MRASADEVLALSLRMAWQPALTRMVSRKGFFLELVKAIGVRSRQEMIRTGLLMERSVVCAGPGGNPREQVG
jgi:hypothetical protein